jgi:energy-coupling factor transporter transmembrane protein EcfT
MKILYSNNTLHFLTILVAGSSASLWAVFSTNYLMPLLWLIVLSTWIVVRESHEIKKIFKLIIQIGSVLLVVSMFQIIFRRHGTVVFSINNFPLVYSEGLMEAVLLWIRYMLIFMLAYIFSRVPVFNFFLFLNKIRIPMKFALLLLTALKFLPFIYDEALKGLWSLRFRGFDPRALSWKQKYIALRKLLNPLLFRGIHYVSYSSLALELRGYGLPGKVKMKAFYPIRIIDYLILLFVMIINLVGIVFI